MKSDIYFITIWIFGITVDNKNIRALEINRVKKLITNAVLRNNISQVMIFRLIILGMK